MLHEYRKELVDQVAEIERKMGELQHERKLAVQAIELIDNQLRMQ